MNNEQSNSSESSRPSTAAAAADDDDLCNESLFHSCISATGFLSEGDASNGHEESEVNSDDRDVREFARNRAANDTKSATAAAPTNEPPLDDAFESSNETSNSHSTSSWNLLPPKDAAQTAKVNSLTFDRHRTCLILSTSRGVRIRTLQSLHYSLLHNHHESTNTTHLHDETTTHDESWIYDIPFQGGATYAQFLHTASLLALISPSSPRCCFLYHAKNASNALAALPMSAAVKRVELTRSVLVCITADGRLQIFHMRCDSDGMATTTTTTTTTTPLWIQTLNVMHPSDTVRNITRGMNIFFSGSYFDLSPDETAPYLVCKSFHGTAGTLRVYDPTRVTEVEISSPSCGNVSLYSGDGMSVAASTSSRVPSAGEVVRTKVRRRCHLHTTIDAHEHAVTRMLIGGGGGAGTSFLATVSSKGTTVRVFGLPRGEQLWEWHRGSRSCHILSLSWNGSGDRLVSYGSSGTIHVFEWNHQQAKKAGHDTSTLEYSHGDVRDFEELNEDRSQSHSTNNATGFGSTSANKSDKPLYKRIGASIRWHTVGGSHTTTPLKRRSFAKLKYQSTGLKIAQQEHLVVALLDRQDTNIISGSNSKSASSREDTVVMCTLTGELRQYSVKLDGCFQVIQMEDVLFRGANISPSQT
ncbi:hypothetical protein HJC23_002325 [Cyclotella cryptica]|uniref:Uncharacterized protein n=1 Tax=Cyclotella cryptica TaxID=29204 RepID=A0ABD3QLB9_9STRA|eukprot:CCRYP_004409-RA/>CCRYP_004409-RA protein AED:0.12 eAED:0.53 QI:0/-1/0/1/-1/1/1/0/640